MKRTTDFIVSLTGLIVLFPLFLVIGSIIWMQDGGNIFFVQKRMGKNRQPFRLYKFRSMRFLNNDSTGRFEPGDSKRITPFGRFIRKAKIDELPQLVNVLKGDMSLVGPRPEVEKWVNQYPERWRIVLTVKPGITDNASVLFRHEESLLAEAADPEKFYREVILPKKLDLYEAYILHHSLLGDFKIIIRTLFAMFRKC